MAEADPNEQMTDVTFEELIELENEHNAVDTEILRRHWQLSEPLFKRRRTIVPRIPHFWPLVFDEAPPEIENHIQPSDSRVFAEYLQHFDVERFELETEPRSILLSFEFAENPYFEDKKLEKRFWWRKSLDGWSGLVSEPVAIQWKAGNDLTNGLTNATLELWKRWKELGGEGKRKGFSSMQEEPTYAALKTKLEESDFSMHSFFTLFTFVSTLRYVTAEESKEADEKEAKEKTTKTNGAAKAESDEKDEDGDGDDLDVMACPHGDDLATVLVEELYSNAIKYFTSAHEQDSEEQSEDDFEDDEDIEDGIDSEGEEEHSGPPKKKHKHSKHGGGCC